MKLIKLDAKFDVNLVVRYRECARCTYVSVLKCS